MLILSSLLSSVQQPVRNECAAFYYGFLLSKNSCNFPKWYLGRWDRTSAETFPCQYKYKWKVGQDFCTVLVHQTGFHVYFICNDSDCTTPRTQSCPQLEGHGKLPHPPTVGHQLLEYERGHTEVLHVGEGKRRIHTQRQFARSVQVPSQSLRT